MPFEFTFLDFLQTVHNPILDTFFVLITKLGDYGILWFLLAFYFISRPEKRKIGILMICALAFNFILCDGIIKNIFDRARPCDINTTIEMLISRPHGHSFPSGHTSSSFCMVAILYFMKEKKSFIFALICASLIGFSRMYLYVHFPTDVLAGMIFGWINGYIVYRLFTFYSKSRALH